MSEHSDKTPLSPQEGQVQAFHDFEPTTIEHTEYLDPQSSTFEKPEWMGVGSHDFLGASYINACNELSAFESASDGDDPSWRRRLVKQRDAALLETRRQIERVTKLPDFESTVEREGYVLPDSLKEKLTKGSEGGLFDSLSQTDDETLIEFIHWNMQHMNEVNEWLAPEVERIKADFVARLEFSITEQHLPLTLEQLHSRMALIKVEIVDPFAMGLESTRGSYDHLTGVKIAETSDMLALQKTLYHELLHHLSGKTVSARQKEYKNSPFNSSMGAKRLELERSGLAHDDGSEGPRWLNEAITEQLAQFLLSDEGKTDDFSGISHEQFMRPQKRVPGAPKPSDDLFTKMIAQTQGIHKWPEAYSDGRSVLGALLRNNALDTGLLLAAYFEDYLPAEDAPMSKTKQAWSILRTAWGDDITEMLSIKGNAGTLKPAETKRIRKALLSRRIQSQ